MGRAFEGWSLPLIAASLVAIALGLSPVRDLEVFWHVAMGRFIAATGAVPSANHLLYTVPLDAPSFVLPWLSERSLWSLYELLGVELLVVLRSLIGFAVVLGAALVARARGLGAGRAALTSAAAGLVLLWPTLEPGPGLFALALFAPLLWVARSARDRRLPLWTLLSAPLAGALWVNMHASFLLPALICLCFGVAAGIDLRRGQGEGARVVGWGVAAAASMGAVVANPRGLEVFGHLVGQVSQARLWAADSPLVGALLALAAAALIAGWMRQGSRRGEEGRALDPADVGLGLLLILAAAWSRDAVPLFAAAWPILMAPLFAPLVRHDTPVPSRPSGCAPVLAALVLFAVAVAAQPIHPWQAGVAAAVYPGPVRDTYPLKGSVPPQLPVEAVEILKSWGSGGQPIFHDRAYAGYLALELLEGRPQPILWVDPRGELLPDVQQRVYDLVSAGDPAWRGVLQQYDIRVVVLDLERQAGLARELEAALDWQLVVEGARSALYERR